MLDYTIHYCINGNRLTQGNSLHKQFWLHILNACLRNVDISLLCRSLISDSAQKHQVSKDYAQ